MSSLFLELKYARLLGSSIERWKVKSDSPFKATGRCPICGDSAKSKTLCRFHVREYEGACFVSCFNCGYSNSLVGYLKVYQNALHSEFSFEKYRINGNNQAVIKTQKVVLDDASFICTRKAQEKVFTLDLPLVSDLPKDDPVRLYVASRKLPEYPFQYAREFYKFSSQFNQELSSGKKDEPRLVIPFFDRKGSVFSYQGRDLSGKAAQKYITITVNPKVPKIFGIDKCDFTKPIKIVEGPIDSLFLKNSLASVNASLVACATKLLRVVKKENITLGFDNEPRNKEILKMYSEAINLGFNVVVWPTSPNNKEDINDLVKRGLDPEKIIKENTYSGIMAQIQFNRWKRL